ncbi:MAG: HPr family phosphocarrier protein [Eubacterium sp.]|nr:HPr family phosphocarrier protein [Eubacterium sp.]
MADYVENVKKMADRLGGSGNIVNVTNCMTRVRVTVRDDASVDAASIRVMDDVLELIHDRDRYYEIVVGPGKSRKYADKFHELGLGSDDDIGAETGSDDRGGSDSGLKRVKAFLKTLGDIFVPLIPGIIAAGLCAGFAAIIAQLVPDYADIKVWNIIYNLLSLINNAFMTYLTAWAGYRAAERFGATPILGGMLGMITTLPGIADISQTLELYDEETPLNSILNTGKGGVLAVIVGVFLLSIVEKKIRSKMPESVDVIFTPLLTMLICAVPYILIIMPALGYVSSGIVWVVSRFCLSESIIVRIIAGYVSAAMFLPLVAAGMHHGLVALYSVQLQEIGYVTLYPALAMAGAGQVGAAIAIYIKAKHAGDKGLCSIIKGALPAGFLGVGEPLIYGVTLPLGKPFITAGLGAGFGGALVMAAEVASTTWGPSGILGAFVMTSGPNGAVKSVMFYLAGLLVSYICAFLITDFTYSAAELAQARDVNEGDEKASESTVPVDDTDCYPAVHHGDPIMILILPNSFEYTIKDPAGIHARPAGKLSQIAKQYDCKVEISANGKTASARSVFDIMELGASQGTLLKISAEGKDSDTALKAVKEFLEQNM